MWLQVEAQVHETLLSRGSQQQKLESYTGRNFKSDKKHFKKFGRSSGLTLNAATEQKDDASCPLDKGTHRFWSCEKFKNVCYRSLQFCQRQEPLLLMFKRQSSFSKLPAESQVRH